MAYRTTPDGTPSGAARQPVVDIPWIHLEEFSLREAEQLIGEAGQIYPSVSEIPLELVRLVTERAQGNPFFIEAAQLLEIEASSLSQTWQRCNPRLTDQPAQPDPQPHRPLEREPKITLKVASVIGRLFRQPCYGAATPKWAISR
jgi:hypothetical protein